MFEGNNSQEVNEYPVWDWVEKQQSEPETYKGKAENENQESTTWNRVPKTDKKIKALQNENWNVQSDARQKRKGKKAPQKPWIIQTKECTIQKEWQCDIQNSAAACQILIIFSITN